MLTSSNENICRVTGPSYGDPPGTGGFLLQRPVTRNFDVSIDLRLNKRLSKHSRRRWFEAPLRSFWRHCNVVRKRKLILKLLLAKIYNFGKYVRLSVCYLPKFTIFGKYVRLSVCYLPKFTIFGKYVRLSVCYLPKFTILASMFVCRFVCLSVRFVKHNSWTLWHIITKLGPHMEWVSSSSMWHWQISRSWN